MNPNLVDLHAVIAKALPLCEPLKGENKELEEVAQLAMKLVKERTAGLHEVAGVFFGGSFAKGTWLRGDADIDIFVKIRPSVNEGRFEELGKEIGLSALKAHRPQLRYSDHPYVEAFIRKVRVNIVPCYEVEQGKWQSAADRSPFHTEYVSTNFDSEKRNQARLLKRFFKSCGVYGAEISTGGFSGYVAEVLVQKYGSFESVLRAGSTFRQHQVIAVDDKYDPDIVKGFHSSLVVIDPVDIRRNLGTAISPESVGTFMLAARAFLDRPSLRYFKVGADEPVSRKKEKIYRNLMIVELRHRQRSPDIIWGQLKRCMNAIAKQLEIADFVVLRSSCVTDEKNSAALAFLLESLTLPPFTVRKGPQVYRSKDTASFALNARSRSHAAWVDREMRITTLVDRQVTDAGRFIKSLFGDRWGNSGIPKDLVSDKAKIRIYSGSEKKITGLAKEVVGDIVSTAHFIFGRA